MNTATGNDTDSSIDLAIPGPGDSAIIIDRNYNSQDQRDGPFGRGTSFMYDMRLSVHDNPLLQGVQVRYPDGHTANFRQKGASFEPASPGNFDRVERAGSNYVLRLKDRSSFVFDANGRLIETRTRNGVPITLTYNAAGKPVRIADQTGRAIMLTWVGNHITQIAAPENKTLRYTYSGAKLTSFTNGRNGPPTTFQHDGADRITAVITPNGYPRLRQELDDRGRVKWQIIGEHERFDFTYIDATKTTTVAEIDGATTYVYNDNYFLKQITDKHDEVASFVYDNRGNLRQRTDRRGNTWSYDYDENGNRTLQTDPPAACAAAPYGNDITRWRYDAFSQVISKTDSLGFTWLYTYSLQGNLTELREPNGALTTLAYDPLGQTRIITDANGHRTQFFYDPYGNQVNTIDAATSVFTVTFDLLGRATSQSDANNHTTRYFYDGNDNITRTIDPRGHAWNFGYDDNNNLLTLTNRRGITSSFQYDQSDNLTLERAYLGALPTLYGYDQRNRLVAITDTLGYTTLYTYDPLDRLTQMTDRARATFEYQYDENGNQTAVIDPFDARTSFEYDAVNRLSAETNALGSRIESCYDSEDRLVVQEGPRPGERYRFAYDPIGRLTRLTDPQSNTWTSRYDPVGNLEAAINPLDHRTDYSYDSLNRLEALARPLLPDGTRPTTRYRYDPLGNLVGVSSPRGFSSAFTYDENNNLLTARDATEATSSFKYDEEDNWLVATDAKGNTTTRTYGPNGLPVTMQDGRGFITRYAYDPANNLTLVENALSHPTRYAYDPEQRLISVSDPLAHTTLYHRDLLGRVTAVEDANSKRTSYSYDLLGRLIAVTDGNSAPTRYAYDEVDNLIAITDANGHSTRFSYNLLDQLLVEENPLGERWSYAYDPSGRQIRRIDALGHPTSYAFDSNDRLIGIQYGATAAEQAPVTFSYDADGNQTGACNGLGCLSNTYDPVGRRVSTTDEFDRTVRRSYDAQGNLLALTYPDDRQVRYAYDQTNQPVGVTLPGNLTSLYERDALGRATQLLQPNGLRTSYAYDEAGRLTSLAHRLAQASAPISAFGYRLDAAGNRIGVRETRAAFDGSARQATLDHSYSYDGTDRLTEASTNLSVDGAATGDRATSYSFDPAGNRLALGGTQLAPSPGLPALPVAPRPAATSYEYNAANQLVRAGDTAIGYDANGNRAQERRTLPNGQVETIDYTYDRENRLVTLTKAVDGATTLIARYEYDSYGRRVRKTVSHPSQPDEITTFLYDGLEIIGERIERGDRSSERYYYLAASPLTGMRRPFAAQDPTSGATNWYMADGLDSVLGLTDEAGRLIAPSLYDDYGSPLASDSAATRFTYTGQDYDAESGLLHFHARYYDSARGVWLTQDSYRGELDSPGTMHRYGYVGGNPIRFYDNYGYSEIFNIKDKAITYVKDQWLIENKNDIEVAAAKWDISPELLAAVLNQEGGGSPMVSIKQTAALTQKSWPIYDLFGKRNCSFGDSVEGDYWWCVSVGPGQFKPVTALGLDKAGYSPYAYNPDITAGEVITRLNNTKTNIEYTAAYIKYAQDVFFKDLEKERQACIERNSIDEYTFVSGIYHRYNGSDGVELDARVKAIIHNRSRIETLFRQQEQRRRNNLSVPVFIFLYL